MCELARSDITPEPAGQQKEVNSLRFRVVAKRFGNSVQFEVEAVDVKDALQKALEEANRVFGYKSGDAGAPTVSVKPIEEKE